MNYYLDTEFHEHKKKPLLSKPIDTIELISIGIVSDDGREYYAVCNEFDLKAAWKNGWLRQNVLKPIHLELCRSMDTHHKTHYWRLTEWSYKGLKRLLKWKGKSKKQISIDIVRFTGGEVNTIQDNVLSWSNSTKPKFYAYYADYDWVVFCWLFGRMIDLPKGFPMYCIDLKQTIDEQCESINKEAQRTSPGCPMVTHESMKKYNPRYPIQINEHNALSDAQWNKELHQFLKAR
jgi:hypothetical protein